MVYVSRRARREQEEREEAEAAQQQQQQQEQEQEQQTQQLEVPRRERRRRHDNEEEGQEREASGEREGSERYRRRMERERYYTQGINPSSLTASSNISTPSPPPRRSSGASPNPGMSSMNMSTTAAGNKLAKEIHDEFLTCKICLEGFKSPKCLDCLHTFCEQCIDNHVLSECTYKKYSDYREFTCPLCRKRTQLPVGGVKKLPDNFLVSSLGEVVARQKPSKFPFCDICKLINRKHREATSKCIDCNKLMCKPCVDMHRQTKVTQLHSIFDVEIEKDIECKEHQDEVVRFYCEPCESCICVLCTFNEHKDHEISQFSEAVCKYKENIQGLLSSCKDKIDIYDKQIALLDKCEGVIKAAEQRIHDAAIQFISEIRNKEKVLIEDLHSMYGSELMEYVNRKNEMQNNLDGLKSTCNLTELVLKGKDIELLLLKRQVQEKLSVMAKVELKDLPPTIGKRISFVTGSLELGQLEDADSPVEKGKKKQEDNFIEKEKKKEEEEEEQQQQPKQQEHQEHQHSASRRDPPDQQRLTLTNMVFGRKERDGWDDVIKTKPEPAPVVVEKKTATTQTDKELARPTVRLANRAIQVDIPGARSDSEASVHSHNFGQASPQSYQHRATGTDAVSTVEKACNTRPRGLQHELTTASSLCQTDSPVQAQPADQQSSTGLEHAESPVPQRHRRRRERNRGAEGSARSAAANDTSEGGRFYE